MPVKGLVGDMIPTFSTYTIRALDYLFNFFA